MKLHGKTIEGPSVETIVFPRESGELVFKAQAILNYEEFEALAPQPEPPFMQRPGQQAIKDLHDKKYLEKYDIWLQQKVDYMIIKSLEATPGLEWDTVVMTDPTTWHNYKSEFSDSGISDAEVTQLISLVTSANGMDQDKIDQATKSFLAGQGEGQKEPSSQNTES